MFTISVNGHSRLAAEKGLGSEVYSGPANVLPKEYFIRMLSQERKRTERSHRRFVLMLLEARHVLKAEKPSNAFAQVLSALSKSTRETDIIGWYETDAVIGVIYTEIGAAEGRSVASALSSKLIQALGSSLSIEQINKISLSFHVFPEQSDDASGGPRDARLYPDTAQQADPKKLERLAKRFLDISGSLLGLVFLSPLLLFIFGVIKLTSAGPAIFRQARVGLNGRRFTFLKFRSMYHKVDPTIHEQYVKGFISGHVGEDLDSAQPTVFKLTNDPRITPVGRFLRRTSLDELPQLWNVLRGDMSLVGPRPPLPYEFGCYEMWHRRRLLAVKPGITGLWQVEGRSKVHFDDMVRMDLKYSSTWSVWLDLKILFKTPRAVVSGDGAY